MVELTFELDFELNLTQKNELNSNFNSTQFFELNFFANSKI